MCGIAGIYGKKMQPVKALGVSLKAMGALVQHRGPDGRGQWEHRSGCAGLNHQRLSIIDLERGGQPMIDEGGRVISYNGELYNHIELRREIGESLFRTASDTEVILRSYHKWGRACVEKLRGMFAFAIWDEEKQELFCARDRFGIKPFYYCENEEAYFFASEIKALLPFLPEIETDRTALLDYLTFQFCLDGRTLFKGVSELPPGHALVISAAGLNQYRYWDVNYVHDWDHTEKHFLSKLEELLLDSVKVHLRADVPIGAYLSGGIDSSLVATLGAREGNGGFCGFHGFFSWGPEYDESRYAEAVAGAADFPLHITDITADDFVENIAKVVYHLDYPVAGPGSFPQYMVSRLAAQHRKVVFGGQGGDEVFGGYTRYLIAYFEQVIKGAIDGTMTSGNFVVTYESIIPNLSSLRNYKPLLKEFWREGLFDSMDRRYFRLINRAPHLGSIIRWDTLPEGGSFERFERVFHANNVGRQSYFDLMTHFDFKTLLPALLQVEDRMSMAHGLESRVPLLDHALVEFAATVPADVKFRNGDMKHLLKEAARSVLPQTVMDRTDKMGFPTPLNEWLAGPARSFLMDTLSGSAALGRDFVDNAQVVRMIDKEPKIGRNLWALLCLELWQSSFHDRRQWFLDHLNPAHPAQQLNYNSLTVL